MGNHSISRQNFRGKNLILKKRKNGISDDRVKTSSSIEGKDRKEKKH